MLGPIKFVMGGDALQSSSAGSGGGGSSLTISNNISGYVLRATGEADRIAGIPQLRYDTNRTTLTASAGIYISGSNDPGDNYLYLHGTDSTGAKRQFKIEVSGSLFKVVAQD
jgi:hypothetical protein